MTAHGWYYLWIGLALFAALILGWIIYRITPGPCKWDMAASNMELEGYTDLEILEELGPRPKK